MLKDCVIWDGRGGNDYSPPLVIKTAGGELWRIMTAILYFAFVKDVFFFFKDLKKGEGRRNLE